MKKEIKEQVSILVQSIYKKTDDINEAIDKIMEIVEGDPAAEADQPTPAPETVRLWCGKDYSAGYWYTRGKVYNTADFKTDIVESENGKGLSYSSIEEFWADRDGFNNENILFPLLHRPAKEGEWARNIKTGGVINVLAGAKQTQSDGVAYGGKDGYLHYMPNAEYEVIENYHGEHEPKPEEPKRTWTDPENGRVYELKDPPAKKDDYILVTKMVGYTDDERYDINRNQRNRID